MAEISDKVRKEMAKADRAHPSDAEKAELLAEVNQRCPLCYKSLISTKGSRPFKDYQIAHIYPHSATTEQFLVLENLPRVDDLESVKNLIPLCRDCHARQDFHTTKEDYLRLYTKKIECAGKYAANKLAFNCRLEPDVSKIVSALGALPEDVRIELSLNPLKVSQKIDDKALCEKVRNYVVQYFGFVQSEFAKLQDKERIPFEMVAVQVRHYFLQVELLLITKEQMFDQMVNWVMEKTGGNRSASEIVVSFFVQDCEVFREIAK